jgi:SWI/SNF chromatin-remodeling complex subunit SWI1
MHPDLSPRLPIASSSSISSGNTEAGPPHRLRQKVTYEPLQRQPPTDGGYPLDALQCSRLTLTSSRVPVPPSELGQIDIERLSLSLASRVPTEVSYALGVLTLIAVHPYPLPGKDKGNWIGLDRCPEVLEELVELLEEVAFGGEGGLERWEESCQRGRRGSAKGKERERAMERRTVKEEAGVSSEATSSSQPTHQMLVRLLEEESIRSSQSTSTSSSRIGDSSVLPPSQVISAIVNIVHRFSGENLNENNGPLAHDKRLIRLLLALTDVRHAGFSYDAISRSFCPIPSASSPLIPLTELLVIRRDVLLLIHHLAFHLKLQHASFTPFFPASIFDFVASYITDAAPSTYSFLSPNDHTKSLEDRPPPSDLTDALAVFSRLSLIDQEYPFFSTLPPSRLWTLYRSLLLVLPITPAQFHLTGCESWLGLIENVSLCLFNLTYLCPPVIRARIRSDPAGLSVLLRCLRTYLSRSHEWMVNPYAIVCRRFVETFAQINEDVDSGAGGPPASLDFGRGVGEEETRLLKMDFERKRAGGNAGSLMGRDLEPLFVGLIDPEIELFNAMDVLLWKS